MAKKEIPFITEISRYTTKDKFLPVYFLCGEDQYTIELAAETIEKNVMPNVLSDFDKEIVNAEKSQGLQQVLDLCYSFPFGGGKKMIILKNFEKITDKKVLLNYLTNLPEFTILVIIQNGKISDFGKEPYSILLERKFLFEARVATGQELYEWIVKKAKTFKLDFTIDNAQSLVEIVGEDKSLLEMQLEKFGDYIQNKSNITFEDIKKIASPTKEYSIFDLQDAIGKGNKPKAIEIAYNLLDAGVEIIVIINMLAKFVLTVAQIPEFIRSRINDNEAAKMASVSWAYYINCKKAAYLMTDERLLNASRALLNADIATKSTSASQQTVLLILIAELLGQEVTSSVLDRP
jgi:DNA polymerase III subunit delta